WTSECQALALGAERFNERVMNDLDDLLAGRDRANDRLADRALAHLLDEVLDHGKSDIGIDERCADFGERGVDIGFRQRAASPEPVEYIAQTFLQVVEHANLKRRSPQGAHLRCLRATPG